MTTTACVAAIGLALPPRLTPDAVQHQVQTVDAVSALVDRRVPLLSRPFGFPVWMLLLAPHSQQLLSVLSWPDGSLGMVLKPQCDLQPEDLQQAYAEGRECLEFDALNHPAAAETYNYLLTSSIDGRQYAIKPGFQVSDIPRAAGAIAAFTPAGRATTVVGAGLKGAATQAAIEGTQAATGGEFNPGDVAAAGALGAAAPVVGNALRYGAGAVRRAVGQAPRSGASPAARPTAPEPDTPVGTTGVKPIEPPSQPRTVPPTAQPTAQPPQAQPPMPVAQAAVPGANLQQLGEASRTAAAGGIGAKRARDVLAHEAAPDPAVLAAARRLGIEDHLQPDHIASSTAYRELAQAVKSMPGSVTRSAELEGLELAAMRASNLIDEIGGTRDLSQLSTSVKQRMQAAHDTLRDKADTLYGQVRKAIPAKTEAPAGQTVALIRQRADELGGEQFLTPLERQVLATVGNPKAPPTYARLDDLRVRLNAAKFGKGEEAFASADDALRDRVLTTLRADQEAVATAAGQGETWALAQQTARAYKGLQDDMSSLFGKALDGTFTGTGANGLQGAVKAVSAGDSAKLVRLLSAVPEPMRAEVVATGIGTMFRTAATKGEMNFGAYAKWYEGLKRNRQAYAALMSNLPLSARKQLEALYRVSDGISLATRERITTGRIQAVQQELKGADTLMANLYGLAKRASAGAAAEAVTAPIGLPGAGISAGIASALTKGKPDTMKAVDALISSPEFIRMAKAVGTEQQAEAVRRFASGARFSVFFKAAGAPGGMPARERWVLNAMQAERQQ